MSVSTENNGQRPLQQSEGPQGLPEYDQVLGLVNIDQSAGTMDAIPLESEEATAQKVAFVAELLVQGDPQSRTQRFGAEILRQAALVTIGELKLSQHVDKLTGAPNRAALEYNFPTIKAIMARNQHAYEIGEQPATSQVLFFLDLDGFKQVNDTFGHDQGDEVLIEAMTSLGSHLRPTDEVYRLGGDEIIVIAGIKGDANDATDIIRQESVAAVADRIHNAIDAARQKVNATKDEQIPGDERGEIHLGVSVGGALIGEHDELETVLKRADAAMYRCKTSNRNSQNGSSQVRLIFEG